ncbi:YeeE/YedE family protein [soil metagenome]
MNPNIAVAVPLPAGTATQGRVVIAALAVIGLLGIAIEHVASTRVTLLFATGLGLGVVLYQSLFGFTSAFRVLLTQRRSAGLRAQMVMLAIACALFFPALSTGSLLGQPVTGFVSPAGVSVALGAFLFGIGMQMGGGCASGTLFSVGGGSTRMLVTLLFFVIGSVIGITHVAWWQTWPAIAPVSLITVLGWPGALAAHIGLFLVAYLIVVRMEKSRHGDIEPIMTIQNGSWRQGPWPLIAGAIGLAALNFGTLWLAGRPWGITSAFGLWGGMALQALGVPVQSWSGYGDADMQGALGRSVLADVTSVMDFGIMLGAMVCAGIAGKFKPQWRITARHLCASILGGLLLGYGARLAYGCNIGAFFSGIASGSLHGWLWIVFALPGNWVGIRLKPALGLSAQPYRDCDHA